MDQPVTYLDPTAQPAAPAALHHQGAPQMVRPTMSRMISADPAKMRCSRAAV
jgi:hypothetical protein